MSRIGVIGLALSLTSLSASALAAPQPPTPSFGASCDAFATYDPQSTCSPTAKPGAVSFRDFILGVYPITGDYGISRECSAGGTSEHKEGRAWDWKVDYFDTTQRDVADTVIAWMLATDSHGNACALARRIGVMYFIWNKEIWGAYRSPNESCATAGYKAYTGTNPHTDHVHISFAWAGANAQTSWFSAPIPTNQPPAGTLDAADCERVYGWTQDPDAPQTPNEAHLYFGGAAGDPNAQGVLLTADLSRADLCGPLGSCEHGFEVASPLSLHDGAPHPVHAYGIDSAGGPNSELAQSPGTLSCAPVIPAGVRRHVSDDASFIAWDFSQFWDVMPVADTALSAVVEGTVLPVAPVLVQSDDGDPAVWVVDGTYKRYIPGPAVFDAWGFDWNAITVIPAADLAALTEGPALRDRPVLIQASGPAVYLMDDPLTDGPGGSGNGGSGWGSGGAAGSSGSGANPGAGGGQKTQVLGEGESGCACRTPRAPATPARGASGSLLAALALLAGRRRRRA